MKEAEAKRIGRAQKNFIDPDDGKVYVKGLFIGFGIQEKGTNKVHMTNDRDGKTLPERSMITVEKTS